VVVVDCDADGNVDLADLRLKAERHRDELAALMVTYPSTHGVFEEGHPRDLRLVHRHGGQVYIDGANMNALVGLAQPGEFGADVSHLNLHKTFCIPHGGGGPGMGPDRREGAPCAVPAGHIRNSMAAVRRSVRSRPRHSARPRSCRSAGLHPDDGWQRTEQGDRSRDPERELHRRAPRPHFPVLYKNHNGRVAHECIVDPRALKNSSGVSEDDIAKRLIDYGFHAPTMSFPVPGT
jgi:glycine dehydrogenase